MNSDDALASDAKIQEHVADLDQVINLETLLPEEKGVMAAALVERSFVEGDVVLQQGEPAHAFEILCDGEDAHHWLFWEIFYKHNKEPLSINNTGVYPGCAMLGGLSIADNDTGPSTVIGSIPSSSTRCIHALGLGGQCLAINAVCSATQVALNCAAQSKRVGKSEHFLAGSNLQLRPDMWTIFCKMGAALLRDCCCKTFEASANSFARPEGAGSSILELLSSTTQKVVPSALVLATFVKQESQRATMTAPSGQAQQGVVISAPADASVNPLDVSLAELHGTGTLLGDAIEVGGLKGMVGNGRKEDSPLMLAAVKSIFGHEEGAVGVARVMTMVAAMKKSIVPRSLHLDKVSPNIDLMDFPRIMPSSILHRTDTVKKAGTLSFGFSGTSSHSILKGSVTAQEVETASAAKPPKGAPSPLVQEKNEVVGERREPRSITESAPTCRHDADAGAVDNFDWFIARAMRWQAPRPRKQPKKVWRIKQK